jgi:ATP:ADP antiporter, AAA family
MNRIVRFTRRVFDIRAGEHLQLWAMFLYLLFVLFAYYIVKPVSRAMFLTKFDIDKLPLLYILIAIFGGIFAYFYSRLATKVSLGAAVTWAMGLSAFILVVLWWLIRLRIPSMVYVLNIWVSLFSVILVSQGWLVAGNLFDARQAKRLYPLLDMGMVIGAAFGGEFTREAVSIIGTESLLLASAGMVALAYVAFLVASRKTRSSIQHARAASEKETDFSFGQMMGDISRVRQLQIIVGMMVVMYLVDTLVEYQFQAMARLAYTGDKLTAFFGQFYGLWLNGVEFVFQLFLTGVVVRWFGVGATLQISPVAIGLSSVAILAAPGVVSASAVRLTEASTRYTLTKTGMELLYMPLPLALRNRIKAFIDICVDRLSRGLGGVLLLFLTASSLHMGVRGIALIVVALSLVWIVYSAVARKEYVASIRQRLESRRLDLASVRLSVSDASTVHMLETTARGENPRQAAYALTLLADAPNYDIRPLITSLAASPADELVERVYEIATHLRFEGLLEQAADRLRGGTASRQVVHYLLIVSPARERFAAELLQHDSPAILEAALEGIRPEHALAQKLIGIEWIEKMGQSQEPQRRALAATAISVRGDQGTDRLHYLFEDRDDFVVRAALHAAGALQSRAYLDEAIRTLDRARLRGDAIHALTAFGSGITGALSDILNDEKVSLRIRRQIPRVLKNLPDQRSVNALLPAIGHKDLTIRDAVLKALNGLREAAPNLNFDDAFVTNQLLDEARAYYEASAALAPFRELPGLERSALRLLTGTIEERLKDTLARLFRLLGLCYPPKDVYSAYLAVSKPTRYDASAGLEFLDSVLERNLKRVLLPLLDAPQNVLDHGQELFGIRKLSVEEAIRKQIHSGDPWLAACAISAAAELQIRSLAADIVLAGREGTPEISQVAHAAQVALA